MGKWLGSNKPPAGADEWIGFLDRGVKLEGTLELAGTFRIDGEVKGTVRCKERLIVGENGRLVIPLLGRRQPPRLSLGESVDCGDCFVDDVAGEGHHRLRRWDGEKVDRHV